MNQQVQVSYLPSPGTGVLLAQNAVIVGGTHLLKEFFQFVATGAGGELAICAPFIDAEIASASSVWVQMPHAHIDLRIVTKGDRDATNAWSLVRAFSWRSVEIRQCRNLHAKVYSFVSGNCGVAMVGSHNLTRKGIAGNIEAGVLFKAVTPDHELAETVRACQEYVNTLAVHSSIFIDTKRWPFPSELGGQEDTRE